MAKVQMYKVVVGSVAEKGKHLSGVIAFQIERGRVTNLSLARGTKDDWIAQIPLKEALAVQKAIEKTFDCIVDIVKV